MMTLTNLLRETTELPNQEVWENRRTLTPIRGFAPLARMSLREIVVVLDLLGGGRSHGAA